MVMEDIVNLIGTLGFPVAIALWLLYERSKNMRELIKVVYQLQNKMTVLEALVRKNGLKH